MTGEEDKAVKVELLQHVLAGIGDDWDIADVRQYLRDMIGVYEIAPPPQNRIVCAWCDKEMAPGVEPVSHGCCAECKNQIMRGGK